MFQKLKEAANGARLRAGQMWRERKERIEEQRASEPAGVTVPAWLVRAAKFASWVATISLMYFLWLYTLDIARDRSADMHITRAGTWTGEIQFWFPYVFGFAIVAFGIPYVAKIAIPTFMSLNWRGNFWPKLWALIIALAVSLVVIAGTFAVQGDQLMERDREAAVAVEGVNQGRAAIEAQIQGITDDLRASTEGNSTQAQAARVGMLAGSAEAAAAEWERSYVQPAERAGAYNTELLRRATGSARAAGAAVERRETLRQQLATAPTVASVQGEVVTERTGWIADTLGWLEGVRAILLSLVMDVVALMMPWIALRLEQARSRQLGMADPGRDLHPSMLLDDLTDEPSIMDTTPGAAARAVFAAGGTREEAEEAAREAARVNTRRRKYEDMAGQDITEYVEKAGKMVAMPKRDPKTGKFVGQVQTKPQGPQPDETGVSHDGGGRVGSVPPGRDATSADHVAASALNVPSPELSISEPVSDNVQAPREERAGAENANDGDGDQHPEPSDPPSLESLPQHEVVALAAEIESVATDADADVDVSAPIQVGASDEVIVPAEQDAQVTNANDDADRAEDDENDEPVDQTEPSREPETNPNRLIAAE